MSNGLYPDQDQFSVVLTWVQTVCTSYQKTAKVAASRQRVNSILMAILQDFDAKQAGLSQTGSQTFKTIFFATWLNCCALTITVSV